MQKQVNNELVMVYERSTQPTSSARSTSNKFSFHQRNKSLNIFSKTARSKQNPFSQRSEIDKKDFESVDGSLFLKISSPSPQRHKPASSSNSGTQADLTDRLGRMSMMRSFAADAAGAPISINPLMKLQSHIMTKRQVLMNDAMPSHTELKIFEPSKDSSLFTSGYSPQPTLIKKPGFRRRVIS